MTDREKILAGLVEHNGQWVTIEEKQNQLKAARAAEDTKSDNRPAMPEKAVMSETQQIEAMNAEFQANTEAVPEIDEYLAAQRRRKIFWIMGFLVIAALAVFTGVFLATGSN